VEGRLAVLALLLEAVLDHADHGAVLVGGDHGQRAVGVADALQPAQLAGREAEPEKAGDALGTAAGGHAAFSCVERGLTGFGAGVHDNVYVVYRDDLPPDEPPSRALADGFGAEPGDEVVEVRAGRSPGELTSRRWKVA